MKKLLFFLLLIPGFCFGQNMVTMMYMRYVPEKMDLLPGDYYILEISPGYKDKDFRIEILQKDEKGIEKIIKDVTVKTELTIHKTDFKMPDGKYEWDYITSIKSNETYSDEMLQIGDCTGMKRLSCGIRLKSDEKYSVRIHNNESNFTEFAIDPTAGNERIKTSFN